MRCCSDPRRVLLACALLLLGAAPARAGTPIALHRSFAGQVNFTGTAASLRAAPNGVDACAVNAVATGVLDGLPPGARVEAAYLYWAGSWSAGAGSTAAAPDWDVVLDGAAVAADRTFLDSYSYQWTTYDFFGGVADVTAQVAAKGNGSYAVSGLDVNTGAPHCDAQTVLAGWALVVVYRHPLEADRVVNVYDGFEHVQGGEIRVLADNFRVAATGVDGKVAHVTWEGDETNSQALGAYGEGLRFNGAELSDGLNPPANQFNSTVNVAGRADTWGVDLDVHDVSPWLSPGDAMAGTVYSSGQDLVLLGAEVISVTNAPAADLAVSLTHQPQFAIGVDSDLVVTVTNLGPANENETVTLTVDVPPGLVLVGTAGNAWTVDASAGTTVTATASRALPDGRSLPPLTVTVRPDGSVTGAVTLAATVSSPTFDHRSGNDTALALVRIVDEYAALTATKSLAAVEDPINGTANPKAIPGGLVEYAVEIANRQADRIDRDTVMFTDAVPAGTALFVGDLPGAGGPVRFTEGAVPSRLHFRYGGLADPTDDVQFSSDGGVTWDYVPAPDALGCDAAVTHVRVTPRGRMAGRTAAGPASFLLEFRVGVL